MRRAALRASRALCSAGRGLVTRRALGRGLATRRALGRGLATRRALRSALCWGDTSTSWDWAARVLTLSDGASALAADGVAGFDALWEQEQLVFRAHSCTFHRTAAALHASGVAEVEVTPRVRSVGRTSFSFACDITAAGEPPQKATHRWPLAATRGTFVRMDPETRRPSPLPAEVAEGLNARCEAEDRTRYELAELDLLQIALDGAAYDGGWSSVVRLSDADSLGHVNNARWAAFAADVTGGAPYSGIGVEYIREVHPGEILSCTQRSDGAIGQLDFYGDGEEPCTIVRLSNPDLF